MTPPRSLLLATLRSPALAATLVAALVLPSAAAQEPQTGAASGEAQTNPVYSEQIDVRLVTLPVLARNRRGEPVTDLQPDEIHVVDGRRTYSVASLTPFFADAPERKELPRVRLITDIPGKTRGVARSTVREPRHLLILADLVNDPPMGRKAALEAVSRFLEKELDPSFQVALMVYDGTLHLTLPFTQDRSAAAAALSRAYRNVAARARITPEARMEHLMQKLETCQILEPDDQFEENEASRVLLGVPLADVQCLRDSMYEYAGEATGQTRAFLDVLEAVVGYAGGLEGHTSVLTIGGNVVLNPSREVAEAMRALYGTMDEINQLEQALYGEELLRPQLEGLMRLAYQNDVSLNFLDRTTAPSDFSVRQQRLLQPGFRPLTTAFQTAQQDLDELASATGGAFVASSRVAQGLRQSLKLMEGGYYVSFYIDDDEALTQKRIDRIRVGSTRSGVILKHRRAFEGVRRPEEVEGQKIRGIIQVGVAEEHEFQGTPGMFIPLRLVLEPVDLGYQETASQFAAEFTVHFRLRTRDGVLLADSYHVLTHTYPKEVWQSGTVDPPSLWAWADLPDGDYFAEAVVTVPAAGNRNTFRRHVMVRGASPRQQAADESADATAVNR